MNPGLNGTPTPQFSRPAREFMSELELEEWRALDSVNRGATRPMLLTLATDARKRNKPIRVLYGKSEQIARRALLKRARRTSLKLAAAVRNALIQDDLKKLRKSVKAYFHSFDTKYFAYECAYKSMKRRDRPHIKYLQQFAKQLNPYKLELEEARISFKKKAYNSSTNKEAKKLRPIVNFGIHHRSRQHLVLQLLKKCYGDYHRDDQYSQVTRGVKKAVKRAVQLMSKPEIEFVAECDISDFFPSVGENTGHAMPALALQYQLPMLPRAVIDSTVLSSGIIYLYEEHLSLEALNHSSHAKTGIPQGSALSSYLAEFIMSDIMSDAETQLPWGKYMTSYVDNIGIFEETADDVNGMIEPLVICSRDSSFGSFGLRRSQNTRHKSQGFIFLGHYLKWVARRRKVKIDVADRNKVRFQHKLRYLLNKRNPHFELTKLELLENQKAIESFYESWKASFKLVHNIEQLTKGLFFEVLTELNFESTIPFRRIFHRK